VHCFAPVTMSAKDAAESYPEKDLGRSITHRELYRFPRLDRYAVIKCVRYRGSVEGTSSRLRFFEKRILVVLSAEQNKKDFIIFFRKT